MAREFSLGMGVARSIGYDVLVIVGLSESSFQSVSAECRC